MNRYKEIYRRVMEEDAESQRHFLQVISEVRGAQYKNLENFQAMFVPNDEYLKLYDKTVGEFSAGLYSEEGYCLWTNQLLFPITDIVGDIRGFAAFDPFVYADVHSGEGTGNYYTYSSGSLLNKKLFMLGANGVFKKAYDDGYLCITDGVFDTVALNSLGVNAMALMGSNLSPEILFQLRFIKRVILVQDNDNAGLQLGNKLLKMHRGAEIFKQKYSKDFDGALRSEYHDEVVSELMTFLSKGHLIKS